MLIVFLNTQQTTFIPCKLFFEVFIVSLDYTLHGNMVLVVLMKRDIL